MLSEIMVNYAQTIVIGNKDPDFDKVPERLREGQFLGDLYELGKKGNKNGNYDGICW